MSQQARTPEGNQAHTLWWTLGTCLFLFASACLVYFVKLYLFDPHRFPVREVEMKGAMSFTKTSDIQDLVTQNIKGSFFSINVSELRDKLQALPGVGGVEVRRQWPDQLLIKVQEHQPVAVWLEPNQSPALITSEGFVFRPDVNINTFSSLPMMQGMPSSSTMVLSIFQDAVSMLESFGLSIKKIQLDERYAWTLVLSNGDRLQLGRQSFFVRLSRFLNVYEQHLKYLENGGNREIDLRYTNGFAVKLGLSLNS